VTTDGPCRILLIGMMGSGKSTIGRLLARSSGWPYVDNDELVLRARGATSRRLVAERGEAEMRLAESEALAHGLALPAPAIVGVAAGVIVDEENRRSLRDGGIVIWLRAAADVLAERARGADHRPWLDDDPVAWMSTTLAEREPLYASVTDRIVETDATPPEAAVRDLMEWLRAETSCAGDPTIRSAEQP
jgi:shikimate kinase